jgi:hypothetical protein
MEYSSNANPRKYSNVLKKKAVSDRETTRQALYKSRKGKNRMAVKKASRGDSPDQWFRIKLFNIKDADKAVVLQSIMAVTDLPVVAYNYRCDGTQALFFVHGKHEADLIKACDKRLRTPAGHRLSVTVYPCRQPSIYPEPEIIDKIRLFITSRYDARSKSLKLVSMENEPVLREDGVYASLRQDLTQNMVLDSINSCAADIVSLDISGNGIINLEWLGYLDHDVCPYLSSLNLADNGLKTPEALETLKRLHLRSLTLSGNPLANLCKYKEDVLNYFPNLEVLDGKEVIPKKKEGCQLSLNLARCSEQYSIDNLCTAFARVCLADNDS